MKRLIIIRGIPGSGKSRYLVQYIITHTPEQENIHECPQEKVKEMERRLLDSLYREGF